MSGYFRRQTQREPIIVIKFTIIASEASFLVCSMHGFSIIVIKFTIIASEASFLVCSMHGFSIIYISRTSCRKCSKCFYVYLKYPPNAILHSANINAQRANVTGSMIWHTNRGRLCRTRLRSPDACILLVNCERSELSGLFNARIFYIRPYVVPLMF